MTTTSILSPERIAHAKAMAARLGPKFPDTPDIEGLLLRTFEYERWQQIIDALTPEQRDVVLLMAQGNKSLANDGGK
jgi:hypothetical protein